MPNHKPPFTVPHYVWPHEIIPERYFYVYTLSHQVRQPYRRGPYARVFYVGKGKEKRIFAHEKEAKRGCECGRCQVIRGIWARKHEVFKDIVFLTENEDEAYEVEREMIAKIGLNNLVNKTTGSFIAPLAVRNLRRLGMWKEAEVMAARLHAIEKAEDPTISEDSSE